MPIVLHSGLFHPDRHVLETPAGEVSLTPMESQLLAYLAERPQQTIPYGTLLVEVWGYREHVRSRTVYSTVSRLRAKIEADPRAPRHILPVPAVGYRFVPCDALPRLPDGRALLTAAGHLASTLIGGRGPGGEVVVESVEVPDELAGTLVRPGAPPRELDLLRARMTELLRGTWNLSAREVAAGEVVVREGEPGAEAFVIRSGRCLVRRAGVGVVRELVTGDVFGELAILSGGHRTATVVADTDLELGVVSPAILREGLGLDTWVGDFIVALVDRFAEREGRAPPAA